jgi:hypothetical protein
VTWDGKCEHLQLADPEGKWITLCCNEIRSETELPEYSTTWQGLGSLIERIQQSFGFLLEDAIDDQDQHVFHVWIGVTPNHEADSNTFASVTASTPFRAMAIAAVLAVLEVTKIEIEPRSVD